MAQAQLIPLKAFAAVAIVACILSAGVSAAVARWDLGSYSHAAALETAKLVSSATTAGSPARGINTDAMGEAGSMMMGMGSGEGAMAGARAHSMLRRNSGSMMNGSLMGMRDDTMRMGRGASSMMTAGTSRAH